MIAKNKEKTKKKTTTNIQVSSAKLDRCFLNYSMSLKFRSEDHEALLNKVKYLILEL